MKILKFIGLGLGGLFGLAVIGALIEPSPAPTPAPAAAPAPAVSSSEAATAAAAPRKESTKATMAKFNQIQSGMSQSQVEAILGAGTELSRVDMEGLPSTVMYQWNGEGIGNMNITFQDGEVISKAQFGLE